MVKSVYTGYKNFANQDAAHKEDIPTEEALKSVAVNHFGMVVWQITTSNKSYAINQEGVKRRQLNTALSDIIRKVKKINKPGKLYHFVVRHRGETPSRNAEKSCD